MRDAGKKLNKHNYNRSYYSPLRIGLGIGNEKSPRAVVQK